MALNPKSKSDEQVRIKLDNRQITVQLKPPKPSKKKKIEISGWPLAILVLSLTLVIVYAIVLMRYVYPKNTVTTQNISSSIGIAYKSPKYLSVGDENIVEISVINLSSKESFTGTITLKFHNSAVPIITTSDQGVSVSIKDLPPDGRLTKLIRIKLTKKPTEKVVYYYLQIFPSDQTFFRLSQEMNKIRSRSHYDKFFISPIDYLRSSWAQVLSLIGGTGVLGLTVNYLWGRFKRAIGWE